MICQKVNYSSVHTYSLPEDWKFVGPAEPEPMGAVSCDTASDSAVVGLLNWRVDAIPMRLQCCVARRGDGFSRHVKHRNLLAKGSMRFEWPRYYDFFASVTVQIGKNQGYFLYGTLKAHVDVVSFSMFTFQPHERRASNGVARWVLNHRKLEGLDVLVCSLNQLLRTMENLAFGYPVHLNCFGLNESSARSYAEMVVLTLGR